MNDDSKIVKEYDVGFGGEFWFSYGQFIKDAGLMTSANLRLTFDKKTGILIDAEVLKKPVHLEG